MDRKELEAAMSAGQIGIVPEGNYGYSIRHTKPDKDHPYNLMVELGRGLAVVFFEVSLCRISGEALEPYYRVVWARPAEDITQALSILTRHRAAVVEAKASTKW